MKLKSLLLGSVAAAGFSTSAHAADLGVTLAALNVCDALGISGLTISSDDNCLAISGGVSYEAAVGDYNLTATGGVDFNSADFYETSDDSGDVDWMSSVEAWLKFVGTADSSFGPAMAVLLFEYEDTYTVTNGAVGVRTGNDFDIDEAYVSIGSSTVFTFGDTGSIANTDQDEPLNYLGLFRSSEIDTGVGTDVAISDGGHVIQVVSDLGNGVDVGLALEAIDSLDPTIVGVINYAGDDFAAHGTIWIETQSNDWAIHAGIEGTYDMFSFVGAIAADSDNDWHALGSVAFDLDMFTIAGSFEADDRGAFGVGGSISAEVADGVSLDLGGRYFDDTVEQATEVAVGIGFDVTDELTLAAKGGMYSDTTGSADNIYFEGDLTWAPGGGFEATTGAMVNSLGAWELSVEASKDFE